MKIKATLIYHGNPYWTFILNKWIRADCEQCIFIHKIKSLHPTWPPYCSIHFIYSSRCKNLCNTFLLHWLDWNEIEKKPKHFNNSIPKFPMQQISTSLVCISSHAKNMQTHTRSISASKWLIMWSVCVSSRWTVSCSFSAHSEGRTWSESSQYAPICSCFQHACIQTLGQTNRRASIHRIHTRGSLQCTR